MDPLIVAIVIAVAVVLLGGLWLAIRPARRPAGAGGLPSRREPRVEPGGLSDADRTPRPVPAEAAERTVTDRLASIDAGLARIAGRQDEHEHRLAAEEDARQRLTGLVELTLKKVYEAQDRSGGFGPLGVADREALEQTTARLRRVAVRMSAGRPTRGSVAAAGPADSERTPAGGPIIDEPIWPWAGEGLANGDLAEMRIHIDDPDPPAAEPAPSAAATAAPAVTDPARTTRRRWMISKRGA